MPLSDHFMPLFSEVDRSCCFCWIAECCVILKLAPRLIPQIWIFMSHSQECLNVQAWIKEASLSRGENTWSFQPLRPPIHRFITLWRFVFQKKGTWILSRHIIADGQHRSSFLPTQYLHIPFTLKHPCSYKALFFEELILSPSQGRRET